MKKLLYVAVFIALLLTGCEKKTAEVAPESLFRMENGATADGVKCGDGPEEFRKAYSGYTIQVAYSNLESNYLVMSIDEIPYEEEIYTVIANFFINGKPVSESSLCRDNNIQGSELYDLLSSSEYLRTHEVIYRYLAFQWQDGRIADIASEELNYNETFETPCVDK
ncbi:MAG: hypothetical protein SOX32_05755 [Candidatus Choladocola sp.]|nr:hypothetical protein [Candidatus Choladocola sp.]